MPYNCLEFSQFGSLVFTQSRVRVRRLAGSGRKMKITWQARMRSSSEDGRKPKRSSSDPKVVDDHDDDQQREAKAEKTDKLSDLPAVGEIAGEPTVEYQGR